MIVKILSRHSPSFGSLIRYILKEQKEPDGKQKVITHNLRSHTVAGWTKEFLENESFRLRSRIDQVYLHHAILSLSSNEDKNNISNEVMNDIARKYIQLHGTDGMYLGAIHRDNTDHTHIHFVISGLQFRTGKSFRLSKEKLHTLKIELQKYHMEKYPELSESICNHGKGREHISDRAWHAKHRAEREAKKKNIQTTIQACFAKAHTQTDFLNSLREAGLHHYERNGHATGIISDNRKFRFSRLGISKESLQTLPIDRTEEEKALDEIRALRQDRADLSRVEQEMEYD